MKTILLVDQDSENLITLTYVLNMEGYTVLPKANADAALSAIDLGVKVGLVIACDCLSDYQGRDFIALLKQRLPDLPIVLLSEQVPRLTYQRWINKEVSDLLLKPVNL